MFVPIFTATPPFKQTETAVAAVSGRRTRNPVLSFSNSPSHGTARLGGYRLFIICSRRSRFHPSGVTVVRNYRHRIVTPGVSHLTHLFLGYEHVEQAEPGCRELPQLGSRLIIQHLEVAQPFAPYAATECGC